MKYHMISSILEFKINLIYDIQLFISSKINLCKTSFDFIELIETKITQHLIDIGFKNSVVINYKSINYNDTIYICPTHNPYLINQWINNKSAFAIKWKYCISYLNKYVVSPEFNYLTRYLYYGPFGTISKGELQGVFPISLNF